MLPVTPNFEQEPNLLNPCRNEPILENARSLRIQSIPGFVL
jgi:hypothetical protein